MSSDGVLAYRICTVAVLLSSISLGLLHYSLLQLSSDGIQAKTVYGDLYSATDNAKRSDIKKLCQKSPDNYER